MLRSPTTPRNSPHQAIAPPQLLTRAPLAPANSNEQTYVWPFLLIIRRYFVTIIPRLIPKTERLRRIDLYLSFLLASRRLYRQQPQSLQIPVFRHRRRARCGIIFACWRPYPQPRPCLQQSLYEHLGQFYHTQ